jgi:threonine/homoserine/homoserine lactone efflux protein
LSPASSRSTGRGRGYISLKTVIDRSFGAMLALLGVKIVAT